MRTHTRLDTQPLERTAVAEVDGIFSGGLIDNGPMDGCFLFHFYLFIYLFFVLFSAAPRRFSVNPKRVRDGGCRDTNAKVSFC